MLVSWLKVVRFCRHSYPLNHVVGSFKVCQHDANIGLVIGGSVIIEELFVYKGIGSFLFFAISQRDYTSMQGVFLVIAVSVVVANILADLLYSRLDPRVRVEGER